LHDPGRQRFAARSERAQRSGTGIGGAGAHQHLREPDAPFVGVERRRRVEPLPIARRDERLIVLQRHAAEQIARLRVELRDRKTRRVAEETNRSHAQLALLQRKCQLQLRVAARIAEFALLREVGKKRACHGGLAAARRDA